MRLNYITTFNIIVKPGPYTGLPGPLTMYHVLQQRSLRQLGSQCFVMLLYIKIKCYIQFKLYTNSMVNQRSAPY
jgi:hypothetical protein